MIRELDENDLAGLAEFIVDAYNDYPAAMWFESEPSQEEAERVFYSKVKGIGSRALVDVVAEDNGTIAGECEIVKVAYDSGVIGIVVRHGYRGKGLGSGMLKAAIGRAADIGMRRFSAEVMEENVGAVKFFLGNGFRPESNRDVEKGGSMHRLVVMRAAF